MNGNEIGGLVQDLCTIIHCYIQNVLFLSQKYEHTDKMCFGANRCVAMSV